MRTKGDSGSDTGSALLAKRLREARLARGWSLRQLERHSGVSNSAISLIEHGARTQPRPSTIRRLADALGVSPAYLVGFADSPDPDSSLSSASPSLDADRVSESPDSLDSLLAQAPPEVVHWVTLFAKFALKEHSSCRRNPLSHGEHDE